jgi:hypothetical protein
MRLKLIAAIICLSISINGFGTITIAKSNIEFDYIIIIPKNYIDEIQPFILHKVSKGISTKLITLDDIYNSYYFPLEGRDQPEQIKYFIKNAKESWNTKFVMLVGGKDIMPVRFTRIYQVTGNYTYYISDLYYADLYFQNNTFCSWDSNDDNIFADKNNDGYIDEVDLYPDIYVGRILTNNESELVTVVDKIINYENTAYNQNWFKNLIVGGGDDVRSIIIEALLPFLLGRIGYPVFEGEFLGDRAAKILSNFTVKKIYASGFFRLSIKSLTIKHINNAINEGAGFLMLNGHGNTDRAMITNFPFIKTWWLPKPNGYQSSDIEKLNNGYKLPVAIFGGCLCGDFNESQSPVAWDFVSHKKGGAIASFACTSGGQVILSSLCTETLHGHIMMNIFKSYAEGNDIIGKIWDDSITKYLNDKDALELGDDFSMLNWHNKLSNHYVLEQWTLFGDPTLKVGGYP